MATGGSGRTDRALMEFLLASLRGERPPVGDVAIDRLPDVARMHRIEGVLLRALEDRTDVPQIVLDKLNAARQRPRSII